MRDASEAQRHRIEALERELEDARREHAELEAISGRANAIERERASLEVEVASLRAEVRRARATLAGWITGSGAVALIAIGAALGWASVKDAEVSARRSADEAQLASIQRAAEVAADERGSRLAAEAAAADVRAQEAAAREHLAQERADELGDLVAALAERSPGAHMFAPWSAGASVVRAEGREVRGRCEISFRADRLQCHARVQCGAEELYPHPGTSGRIIQCVSDARGPRSATDGETTERDGDPVLVLDVEAGTVVVADRAWRVELAL